MYGKNSPLRLVGKRLQGWILFFGISLAITGCSSNRSGPPVNTKLAAVPATRPTELTWEGDYSSPSEIGGFSGTGLRLESFAGCLWYQMTFFSDVKMSEQ